MSLWDLLALFKSTLCPKIRISLAGFPIQLSQGIRTNKLTLRNLTSWESRCSSVQISQACLVKHFALCKKYKNVSVIVQFSRNSSCHFHILKWNSRYHNCVCYQEWRILGNLNSPACMHACMHSVSWEGWSLSGTQRKIIIHAHIHRQRGEHERPHQLLDSNPGPSWCNERRC